MGPSREVATYHHPNPAPPGKRPCKTTNGTLPAREPIPDVGEAADVAAIDAEQIEPK